MKQPLRTTLKTLLSVLVIAILYWFMLPPLNVRSQEMWTFLVISAVFVLVIFLFSDIVAFLHGRSAHATQKVKHQPTDLANSIRQLGKPAKIVGLCAAGVIVLGILASLIGAPLFNASRYKKLLTYSTGSFADDVAELNRSQIPVVDRDSSTRLGLRKLGEMSDLVSQFEVDDSYYTQINFKGRPTRVTPLRYGDAIKWLYNQEDGIPAYITVDMVTQETKLVRLEDGIKYSNSEYFFRNIDRHLRFRYPTKIFDMVSFEIDDNGTPYWIAPTVSYRIGLWSGRDIGGAVLVNAITGDSQYFDVSDIPSWVDQVYVSDLIIDQLNYNGKYQSGFFNSLFGQRGVLQITEGYNYLAIGDDVYLYTGMTSVAGDESNVGFVLVNMRTKETKYYAVPGAEEYSAMGSAEGQVQHLNYKATFPLLLNVYDRPTYFMSLKDDAGLVKMYAFVDVQEYQIVGTGNSVDAARKDYLSKLQSSSEIDLSDQTDKLTKTVSGTVDRIATAVVGGNTCYYIRLTDDTAVYSVPISLNANLPFLTPGTAIKLEYSGDAISKISWD